MGPRIFIRGYTEVGANACGGTQLQWGRGFSSADTGKRRRPAVRRRRFNGAADFHPRILSGAKIFRLPAYASMGPRIFIRGYDAAHGRQPRGKRLQWGRGFSSADTNAALRAELERLLQWGRGFSSADTQPTAASPGAPKKLQWGRGFSSADTKNKRLAWRLLYRFNGAADFHPRIPQRASIVLFRG